MTTPLLRQRQINEMQDDKRSLSKMLENPHIQDKASVARQLRRLDHQLETQTPKELAGRDVDGLVREEKELREKFTEGMPTAEEMRKCPPGAVGKHMAWEKRNKGTIMKWKNATLRLNVGDDDPDLCNIERFRPKTNTLGMEGAQIPGKTFFFPTETYKEGHERIDWSKTGEESNPEPDVPVVASPESKKGGTWSPERRAAHSEKMKAHHAKRKVKEEI